MVGKSHVKGILYSLVPITVYTLTAIFALFLVKWNYFTYYCSNVVGNKSKTTFLVQMFNNFFVFPETARLTPSYYMDLSDIVI